MANKLFKSLFAVAMVLGSALGFVACEEPNEVVGEPTVEVSTTSLNFTNEEGSQEVNITCNVKWTASANADWVTVAPAEGNKNGVITVAVSANDTGALREAIVRVSAIHPEYNDEWENKKITVKQSADENVTVTEELLYSDNFDGKEATKSYGSENSSWPYIDQFPEFANAEGDAAANVTYTGSGVSVRANSTSNSSYSDYPGSGSNNIFFGGGAYFQVNTIAPLEGVNYKVTFGSEKYTQDGDSTFRPEEFLMYISKDGEKWAPVEYTFAGTEPGRWNVATANFTLKAATETLYIKFEAKVASVYRLDDLKLYTGDGGQEIDLDNIQVVEPEPPTTDALYYENFDGKGASKDSNGYWPYIADFPEMKNAAGAAATNVSYEGYNATIRNNSNSDGSYSDYAGSGVNNIFFGKDNSWFMVKELVLESTQKNLTLTFGTEKYSQTLGSKFTPSEFIVSLSADGEKWSALNYTFAGTAEGRWNVATANFTLKEVPAKLYIKFMATAESAYRLDDVTLDLGDGGQEVDLANGTTEEPGGGDEPVNPDQPNVPANGIYESDSAFVCTSDDSTNSCYGHKDTKIGNEAVTGFKLGTGSKAGYFKSGAVSVSGDKYLNFYAVAWKDKTATLYMRVDGGETTSFELNAHVGATGNAPYAALTAEAQDHYSVLLEGLTETSTIEFSTDASFSAAANNASGRAIVFGMKLADEANGNEGGNEDPTPDPEPTPDPTPEPEPTPETMTIAEALAVGQNNTIGGVIEGVVISNLDLNNLTSKKGMYVQDETGGLQFYLAENHTFAFGTKLRIDLTEAILADYNGAKQVSGLALAKIETISTGNAVEAKSVSMADFLANKYEGQYVAIEGVQVAESDLANTWVMGGAHTSINMEDAAGNTFVVFSSKYASYKDQTVAQGSGVIKGIASISKGAIQIIFAQASDFAGLTGERFGNTTPEPEPEPTPDPTPEPEPTPGDVKTITFSFADIVAQNSDLTENAYGSQNAATESTWINWTIGDILFKGARVCKANQDNAGYMQMQGNASDNAKQGFIVNSSAIPGKITKIVVKTFNTKYVPNFNLYLGDSANPSGNEMQSGTYSDAGVATGAGKLYTTTFEVAGDYNFFKMHNNTTGACYFDSLTVYYE